MAIGSIINLGGGGSISGAKGVIICDTSTMTVGDTIRVRDVFDSQNVQNKQVATVGTPVIFEVEPYCYYKVCMVQTINDTPTEVGGVYYTVDLGQTIYVDVLDKTTVGGLQGLLNANMENLVEIGDEVDVYVGGSPVKFQVAGIDIYDSHEIILVAKYLPNLQSAWSSSNSDTYGTSTLAQTLALYYDSIDQRDRQYIKQKTVNSSLNGNGGINSSNHYVWCPTAWEIKGAGNYYPATVEQATNVLLPLFTVSANRIKKVGNESGSANVYWTSSGGTSTSGYSAMMDTTGLSVNGSRTGQAHFLPAFHLTADS